MKPDKQASKNTVAVWGGERGHAAFERSTQVPVVHSVSFGYDDLETWHDVALEREEGHIYSRNTNPTVRAFEEKIRHLEGPRRPPAFRPGWRRSARRFSRCCVRGDRVVSIKDSYGGTNKLFTEFLPPFGDRGARCATPANHAQIEAEVARGCRMLYLESPTNPTVKVVDIERLAQGGARGGRAGRRGQHLRHADQPEPARSSAPTW